MVSHIHLNVPETEAPFAASVSVKDAAGVASSVLPSLLNSYLSLSRLSPRLLLIFCDAFCRRKCARANCRATPRRQWCLAQMPALLAVPV